MLLQGKVACVTGAAGGIGLAIARRFAEEGAAVVLGDREVAAVERAADGLRQAGHAAEAAAVDVTDEASVERFLARALEIHGRVDVAVANAGVLFTAPVVETPREQWDRLLAVNLTGVFLTGKVFGRHLQQQGTGGRIICTASKVGKRAEADIGAYSATKFGVIGLVQSMALELGPAGITVNAVCPGDVDTDMLAKVAEDRGRARGESKESVLRAMAERVPLGRRLTDPREVADAYVFLASPLANHVTGSTVDVTGGLF